MPKKYSFNYDYSRTLWMKMFLARPDFENNRSEVLISFEQALGVIRTVDRITQGVQKIVYLVGWQGLGHDDCYPEMDRVNDFLKRGCDRDGRESLLWLIEEAKKYHTVVSFHGNVADEYDANGTHQEFVDSNAVVNHLDGTPAVIERFNGRSAYKTSYKQFWESGLFKKIWDRFCEAVPVREAGTVHLDNFCIAESLNPETFVEEQDEARNKMLDYIRSLGIDVTTEGNYREKHFREDYPPHPIREALYAETGGELPTGNYHGMRIRPLGRIAAVWWMGRMPKEDLLGIHPSDYSGHYTDQEAAGAFYGAMHGEDIWLNHGIDENVWVPLFLRELCTLQLPFAYLNRHERLRIEEDAAQEPTGRYTAYLSENVVSRGSDRSITKDGLILKQGDDVILPVTEDNRIFMAYSAQGRTGRWNVPDAAFTRAEVYDITPQGDRYIGRTDVVNGQIALTVQAGQALAIRAAE